MSRHRSLTMAMAVVLFASPLGAQTVSRDTSAVRVTPIAAPVVTHLAQDSLAVQSTTWALAWPVDAGAQATTRVAPVRRLLEPQSSESVAMMVVGGAALVVGAVVGGKPGTVIMVSGGVLGLVGLWKYAR
jgi:hypothetical protein